MCAVQCACALCAPYLSKKQCLRMFTKFKFNPAHQKSALYLEKQKSLKNSAKCALCSAKCAPVQQCQVRFDRAIQTASKKEAYAENFRKIGRKTKKMCANIPIGFFIHCPINFGCQSPHSEKLWFWAEILIDSKCF